MLPSIEEAWSLPIPAELTSRQGTLNTAQTQQVRSSLYKKTPVLGTLRGLFKPRSRTFRRFFHIIVMFPKSRLASVFSMDVPKINSVTELE